jgi:putative alpha-1,2-mannosidase
VIGALGIVFLVGLVAIIIIPESFAIEALERVPIDSPRLVNAFGAPVFSHVNVNQQVQISADITAENYSGDFAYIVQIRDDENRVISVSWISGNIGQGQSFSPALSWTPSEVGTFTAEIFVWKSLGKPDALSESAKIVITTS